MLTAINHCSLSHSQQQVIGIAFHGLNNQSNVDMQHSHLMDVAYYATMNHYTSEQKAEQNEKDLLLVEEDEENEPNNEAKKSEAVSSYRLQCAKPYMDADYSAVVHGVPFDEHLNTEKVYLLYRVFRI